MLAVLFAIFFGILPVHPIKCDWSIIIVDETFFMAWNHAVKDEGLFMKSSVLESRQDNIYEGAMFNIYQTPTGQRVIIFCGEEKA